MCLDWLCDDEKYRALTMAVAVRHQLLSLFISVVETIARIYATTLL